MDEDEIVNRTITENLKKIEQVREEYEKRLADTEKATKEIQHERNLLTILNEKLECLIHRTTSSDELKIIEDEREAIIKFLEIFGEISLHKLSNLSKISEERLIPILTELKKEKIVVQLSDVKEVSCIKCSHVSSEPIFSCPACNGINYMQKDLVEHYACGNVSTIDYYEDQKCPKCKKHIKVLGVDYKTFSNFFICTDCGDRFPNPDVSFRCKNCRTVFSLEEVIWKISPSFKLA